MEPEHTSRTQVAVHRIKIYSDWVDSFITSLDGRTVYGWGQIGVGAAIMMSPHAGTSGTLSLWGFTSVVYAFLLIGVGGYILARPRTQYYPMLLIPFLVFITALIRYVSVNPNSSLVSVFVYIAYWLSGLRAVRDE